MQVRGSGCANTSVRIKRCSGVHKGSLFKRETRFWLSRATIRLPASPRPVRLCRDPRFPQFIHLEQPRDEDHRRGLISIFVWAKQPLLSDMYVKYNATDVNAERTTPNPVPCSNQLVLVPGVGKYEYGMHFMYAQPVCLDTSYNELLPVQARYSSHDLLLNI